MEPRSRPGRQEVRGRLLKAALAEFHEFGYAGARLEAIARRAGFTKGAVYSNFSSKQALFSALLAEHSQALTAGIIADVDALDMPTAVARASAVLAGQLVQDPQWQSLVVEFALQAGRDDNAGQVYVEQRRELRRTLAEALGAQAEQWGITPRLDAERAATMLLAMLYGLAVEHAADPQAVDMEVMRESVAAILNRVWL